MSYAKTFGLFALAATALLILAGTAAATTITSSEGSTPTFRMESEGATTIHGVVDVTCQESDAEGVVESHGAGVTASGSFRTFRFRVCGNNHVTVTNYGLFQFHALPTTGNFTVTSAGISISISVTSLGLTCVFTTNNTHIGTYVEATSTTTIDSASLPRTGGSIFCGSSGEWTGSYKITSPSGLAAH